LDRLHLHHFSPLLIEIFLFSVDLALPEDGQQEIGVSTAVAAAEAGEISASFFRFLPPPSKSTYCSLAAFSRSFSSFLDCRFFLCDSSLFLEFACRLLNHGSREGEQMAKS
jgi:hypothetical protein